MNKKTIPSVKKPEGRQKKRMDRGRILYTVFLCMCLISMLCLPASAAIISEAKARK